MKNIEEIKNQTYALIDDLKKTTTENGLAGSGNEYVVIVEIFLYKFLNDKFIYEAKKENPELANAEDFFAAIDAMSEDDYEEMCDSMLDTIILKKEHLIPFLAKRQNEDKFAELFDSTLESIASENSDIFYILNEDETRVSIMKPISDVVSGGTNKKNAFCRSLIGDVASFSFENAFEAGYDFFSTIFEYLIKDYNANGGGNYAEYYTPHAIAMSEDDYEEMCDSMLDTIILKKEHLIPFLAKRQNEDKFAELFDSTLESIASENSDIFYILNEDETRVSIMKPISDVVSGGTNKKNAFCRSLIGDVASFSFENAFEAGYDFFSTIFEYLIKDYNANGGGNYAEYYTPHAIAAIMAQLLVDPSEDVRSVTCYDPSAGTGTLVIALAHAIGEQNCTVYTQDISDKSSTMMMLNLILNSMSHSLTHVIQGNTLKHPFHKNEDGSLRKFDYIVSNPPFKLDFSDYHSDLKTDSYKGRFFAGIPNIPSKNKKGMEIYLCFFQHLLYSLKEDGKAAIVVPTGFITAKSGIAFKIRKHLVDGEKSILRGVVSMPSNIFANTGTNVSVVFIDKSGVDKPVLIDASKLGETIKENGNQKTKLRTEEIQQIVNTFRYKEVVEDFSVTPTFDEIKEKGYSFSAGQYFDIKIDYVDITEDEFNRRMDNFKTTLRQQFCESHRLEEEILKQLDCIGFNENVGKENCNE